MKRVLIILIGLTILLISIVTLVDRASLSEEKKFQEGRKLFWFNCRSCHNRDNIKTIITKYSNDSFCVYLHNSINSEHIKINISNKECLILYDYLINM